MESFYFLHFIGNIKCLFSGSCVLRLYWNVLKCFNVTAAVSLSLRKAQAALIGSPAKYPERLQNEFLVGGDAYYSNETCM